jgi:hypothetical protein
MLSEIQKSAIYLTSYIVPTLKLKLIFSKLFLRRTFVNRLIHNIYLQLYHNKRIFLLMRHSNAARRNNTHKFLYA